MVVAQDQALEPAERAAGNRPRPIGVLVVLAVIAGVLGWLAYAAQYQPLTSGRLNGQSDSVKRLTDGVSTTRLALVGPRGTAGFVTAEVHNRGGRAVRVLGVDPAGEGPVGTPEWVPVPDSRDCFGCVDEKRPFPARIAPHHSIVVVFPLRQTPCEEGAYATFGGFTVRFRAYGFTHRARIPFEQPLLVCAPRAVLRHVEEP